MVYSKVRAKLSSLCIISLGQVKFSLDKYIMAIKFCLSLSKYEMLLFPHPWI